MSSGNLKQVKETTTHAEGTLNGDESGSLSEDQKTQEFMQRLLEAGLIEEIKPSVVDLSGMDDAPLELAGKPLSEIIIEDRR
ncbi:MAG: hypothetical protein KY468_12480 [Armatimonadetes bacterium]|nr:hypothetical protein [Armatimonadota bacterium]